MLGCEISAVITTLLVIGQFSLRPLRNPLQILKYARAIFTLRTILTFARRKSAPNNTRLPIDQLLRNFPKFI